MRIIILLPCCLSNNASDTISAASRVGHPSFTFSDTHTSYVFLEATRAFVMACLTRQRGVSSPYHRDRSHYAREYRLYSRGTGFIIGPSSKASAHTPSALRCAIRRVQTAQNGNMDSDIGVFFIPVKQTWRNFNSGWCYCARVDHQDDTRRSPGGET